MAESESNLEHAVDHIVWDWNGTLLDDVDICINILNEMLSERGYSGVTKTRYLDIFGFPIKEYYVKAGFDFSKASFEELAEVYIVKYRKASRLAPLVSGSKDVLSEINIKGIPQSVISASEKSLLLSQIEERGISSFFVDVDGLSDNLATSKKEIGLRWIRETDIDPSRVLLIGDTLHDLEVAHAMGCRSLLVACGHQSRKRLCKRCDNVVNDMRGVLEYINLL